MNFTKDQQQVIDTRGRNLLVSAAAGSGKTAVLVERIIQMITDPKHPVDVDRLLVVTFTRAAAGEMRERIQTAILKKQAELPEDENLQRQCTLIHNASITTIDRFCKSILQNHFHTIGLDPNFRVGDAGELQLLMQDVMDAVLEEAYQKHSERFLSFMESFSTRKNDRDVVEAILRLYQYSQSKPFPEQWLQSCSALYRIQTEQDLEQHECVQELIHMVMEELHELQQEAQGTLELCLEPDGPHMYEQAIRADIEQLIYLQKSNDFHTLYRAFATISYETLGRKSDPTVSEEKKELVKGRRASMKNSLESFRTRFFFTSPTRMTEDLMACKENVEELTSLTMEFLKRFEAEKKERNIVDFGDLEHFALRILLKEENGIYVPSKAALEYRDYFEEILIDEYQDSNDVQELLLTTISRTEGECRNLFMVGDVKQSIYKFRLAKPELFTEKYHRYQKVSECLEALNGKIDLHQNFRSRGEVLDTVNYMFSQLMEHSVGGIDYDEEASLYLGADYPEPDKERKKDYDTEIWIAEEDETKEVDRKLLEARMVAERIKELHQTFTIWDKKKKEYREACYSDIVILLRTNSGWDSVFQEVLEEAGIPTHVASKTGYFTSIEIKTILNYLKLLDNPRDDRNLAAVLKSILGEFSDEELAIIRVAQQEGTFFDAFIHAAAVACEAISPKLREKCVEFKEKYESFRRKVPYLPIHELLQDIIREYHYNVLIGAMPAGKKRRANLDMLLEKATDFENTSYKGLFHFVQYIELLQKYNVDYGEAGLSGENEDTVRIMSIHKSKGLEFPICFVCGTGKKFNTQDLKQRLILDAEYGIGMDYVDPVQRVKESTIIKNYLITHQAVENLGEELRVLYVAMTRAEEKLILTGTVPSFEKMEKGPVEASPRLVRHSSSFLEWIQLAFAGKETDPRLPVKYYYRKLSDFVKEEMVTQVRETREQEYYAQLQPGVCYEEGLHAHLEEAFHFMYPYPGCDRVFAKISVSELKRRQLPGEEEDARKLFENKEPEEILPRFLMKSEAGDVKGSTRGTAFHKVMELLPLEGIKEGDSVEDRIATMITDRRLDRDMAALVKVSSIERFLQSNLARRMNVAAKRNKLFREQPFVLGTPASELDKSYPSEELILIQGIIDAYFEEDDGLVVLDYKTDRVDTGEELVKKYKVQLDYYAKALEQMTGKRVKERLIYSFALQKEIVL